MTRATRPSQTTDETPDWRRQERVKKARAANLAELIRKAQEKVDLFPERKK